MRMRFPYALHLVAMAAAAMLCSCSPKAIAPPQPARTTSASFNALWDASVSVLWEYRFTVDRQDRRAGVITTLPLTSAYGFEAWRPDEVTMNDYLEGLTQTIYRQVTVTIEPWGQPATASAPSEPPASMPASNAFVVRVEVHVSRSDRTDREIESTADAQRMCLRPRQLSMSDSPVRPGKEWVVDELGRDKNLERVLEEKIDARAAKQAATAGK